MNCLEVIFLALLAIHYASSSALSAISRGNFASDEELGTCPINSSITVKVYRNLQGEWSTTFVARSKLGNLTRSIDVNLKKSVFQCGDSKYIALSGFLKDTNADNSSGDAEYDYWNNSDGDAGDSCRRRTETTAVDSTLINSTLQEVRKSSDRMKSMEDKQTILENTIAKIDGNMTLVKQSLTSFENILKTMDEKLNADKEKQMNIEKMLNFMNDTNNKLEVFEKTVKKIESMENSLNKLNTMERNINKLESMERSLNKLETMERKINKLESMEKSLNKLETMERKINKLESMEKSLNKLETMERKINKLESMERSLNKLETMERKINNLESMQTSMNKLVATPNNWVARQFDATVKGKNIALSKDFKSATRFTGKAVPGSAGVISNSMLKEDEVFEIIIEETENEYTAGIAIGVINAKSDEIKETKAIFARITGTWSIFSRDDTEPGKSIAFRDNKRIDDKYPLDTRNLKVGSVLGVSRRRNGDLRFYLDGVDCGPALKDVPRDVYAFVDVINYVTKIRIYT